MWWSWHQLDRMQIICTSSRQITTPVSHHSVFYRPDALPTAQPTASKHWRTLSNLKNVVFFCCGCEVASSFTGHFSGTDGAIGSMCLCVWTITFELNDIWLRYLAWWFTLTPHWSCSKVKIISYSLQSTVWNENIPFLAVDVHYELTVLDMTYFWLFVEFLWAGMVRVTCHGGFLMQLKGWLKMVGGRVINLHIL